jgi:hypothetical protein
VRSERQHRTAIASRDGLILRPVADEQTPHRHPLASQQGDCLRKNQGILGINELAGVDAHQVSVGKSELAAQSRAIIQFLERSGRIEVVGINTERCKRYLARRHSVETHCDVCTVAGCRIASLGHEAHQSSRNHPGEQVGYPGRIPEVRLPAGKRE